MLATTQCLPVAGPRQVSSRAKPHGVGGRCCGGKTQVPHQEAGRDLPHAPQGPADGVLRLAAAGQLSGIKHTPLQGDALTLTLETSGAFAPTNTRTHTFVVAAVVGIFVVVVGG